MEEHALPVLPLPRLYTRASIVIATLLTGPLAGGYMIADNFKRLNDPKRARITWVITTITFAAIVVISIFFERLPNYVLPLVYTILTSRLVTHFQHNAIERHRAEGGSVFSGWRVLLIGLSSLAILVLTIVLIALMADDLNL
jgi:hypothetical protein